MDIGFFKRISDFFEFQTKGNGVLVCRKHNIEHTGKNIFLGREKEP